MTSTFIEETQKKINDRLLVLEKEVTERVEEKEMLESASAALGYTEEQVGTILSIVPDPPKPMTKRKRSKPQDVQGQILKKLQERPMTKARLFKQVKGAATSKTRALRTLTDKGMVTQDADQVLSIKEPEAA